MIEKLLIQAPKSKMTFRIKKSSNFIMALLLCLFYNYGGAQTELDNCIYTVSYDLTTTVEYAVPNDLDMEQISPFDLAKARPYVQHSHILSCIDDQYKLSELTLYDEPAMNPESWMTQNYAVKSTPQGVSLYGEMGDLQEFFPNEQESEEPSLDPTYINEFGYEENIIAMTPEFESALIDEGYEVIQMENGIYAIIYETQEITYDPINQTIEERIYEEGVMIQSVFTQMTTLEDEHNIPLYIIEHYYESMLEGGYMRITTYKVYSNYTIQGQNFDDENVNAMASTINQSRAAINDYIQQGNDAHVIGMTLRELDLERQYELKISPNPARDVLNVKLPKMSMDNKVNVQIIDAKGQIILLQPDMEATRYHNLNISDFDPGLYILMIMKNGHQRQIKFVKH